MSIQNHIAQNPFTNNPDSTIPTDSTIPADPASSSIPTNQASTSIPTDPTSSSIPSDPATSVNQAEGEGRNPNNEELDELTKLRNLEVKDVEGMTFSSLLEAENWYDKYAKACAFTTRRFKLEHNAKRVVYKRIVVCARQGQRKASDKDREREPRSDRRCGCKARMVVKLNSDNSTWRVHEFTKLHNHDMVGKQQQRYMTNNRGIIDVAGDLIKSRLDAGMRPAQIMKLAVHEAGGHANVGYVDTDIYNFAYKNRTQQINGGDAANALTYLKSRKDEDKEFFLEHTENDEGQLMNLFWADSISRTDYACFGDLLLFDTTYKKNHYNIPLFGSGLVSVRVCFGSGLVSVWVWFGFGLGLVWFRFGSALVLVSVWVCLGLDWFRFGSALVLVWFRFGSGLVLVWFGSGLVSVRVCFGSGLVSVWVWFGFGFGLVWFRFGSGLVSFRVWFGFGLGLGSVWSRSGFQSG
ncbi:Protein FAR1-RELATED SEQUENCE 5 [Linum perenne]